MRCSVQSSSAKVACRHLACKALQRQRRLSLRSSRSLVRCSSSAPEFGARDPTAGELASNFGDKVLGNYNTEHIIKPPDAISKHIGLTSRNCADNIRKLKLLEESEVNLLRQQVPGWRVLKTSAGFDCISQEYKVKDLSNGVKLISLIAEVVEREGHHPDIHLTGGDTLLVELCTHSLGGLTENDFIVAAKLNRISTTEFLAKRKPRFWA